MDKALVSKHCRVGRILVDGKRLLSVVGWLVAVFLGVAFPGVSYAQEYEALEPRLGDVLVIGDDESMPREYLFGNPRFVVTDSESNIYVADQMNLEIKVYDRQGTFQAVFGGRGRAPGEFHTISAMTINNCDELIVYDVRQRRFTKFDRSGRVISTSSVSHLWPERIQYVTIQGQEYGYLALSIAPQFAEHGTDIFHVLDEEFRPGASFGTLERVFGPTGAFENMMLSVNPGEFTVTPTGDILYAPGIYEGRLYRYGHGSGLEWEEAMELTGLVRTDSAFEVYDVDDFDDATMVRGTQINPDDGTRVEAVGRVFSTSAGVFERSDGGIVHFTFTTEDAETAELGLEVFDSEGNLTGHGVFDMTVRYSPLVPTLRVAWQDKQGRFYLIDRDEAPVVRVVELNLGQD